MARGETLPATVQTVQTLERQEPQRAFEEERERTREALDKEVKRLRAAIRTSLVTWAFWRT
jgi:hypothetical protein